MDGTRMTVAWPTSPKPSLMMTGSHRVGSIWASPTVCPLRGYRRAGDSKMTEAWTDSVVMAYMIMAYVVMGPMMDEPTALALYRPSPTACLRRGYGHADTQRDRLGRELRPGLYSYGLI